jgi:hypothetical protein
MFIDRLIEGWDELVCKWDGLDKGLLENCLMQAVPFEISNVFRYFGFSASSIENKV